jgi:prevent-host-death family protein
VAISVGMHEAKTTLSRLVDAAQGGEEVVITRRGLPVARLEPVARPSSRAALLGLYAGRIEIAEDFDELPEDISRAFGVVD